jgi:hypothetical protein
MDAVPPPSVYIGFFDSMVMSIRINTRGICIPEVSIILITF